MTLFLDGGFSKGFLKGFYTCQLEADDDSLDCGLNPCPWMWMMITRQFLVYRFGKQSWCWCLFFLWWGFLVSTKVPGFIHLHHFSEFQVKKSLVSCEFLNKYIFGLDISFLTDFRNAFFTMDHGYLHEIYNLTFIIYFNIL